MPGIRKSLVFRKIQSFVNIVNNYKLRQLLSKGPKYRESQPINWKQNFKLLMDSVEGYAKDWAKREKVVSVLSVYVGMLFNFVLFGFITILI